MQKILVRDLMTANVFSIYQNEDLDKLNNLMNDFHIRHVPVVDEEESLVGIVSQRDLIRSALYASEEIPFEEVRDLLKSMTVEDIMVRGVETVEADQNIQEAGSLMLENKLGCLPVVENGRVVGILTESIL